MNVKHLDGFDHLPGLEREREYHRGSTPTLVGEALGPVFAGVESRRGRREFPFRSWALVNRFDYPEWAAGIICQCGSAAEAMFFRPFFTRPDAHPADGAWLESGETKVRPQVICGLYLIDFVATRGAFRLAIEIDGMMWHRNAESQITADYLRARRLTLQGYAVVRFTAQEAFADPAECWRQIDAILTARSRLEHAG